MHDCSIWVLCGKKSLERREPRPEAYLQRGRELWKLVKIRVGRGNKITPCRVRLRLMHDCVPMGSLIAQRRRKSLSRGEERDPPRGPVWALASMRWMTRRGMPQSGPIPLLAAIQ